MNQDNDVRRTPNQIRAALTATALAAGAVLFAAVPAGAQDDAPEAETPNITEETPTASTFPMVSPSGDIKVEYEKSGVTGPCISYEEAINPLFGPWQVWPNSTDSQFILRVDAPKPLCTPVAATAAIYHMPGDREWPQTVGEQLNFTVQDAGTITITFEKQCNRVQFDFLAGSYAPSPINWGGDHQLFFPTRLDTALQYFASASKCQPTTVAPTTAAPTTTPEVSETTAPAEVGSETTTVPSEVLSATTVPGAGNTAGSNNGGAALAATGSNSVPLTAAGVALIGAGTSLVIARRRHLAG